MSALPAPPKQDGDNASDEYDVESPTRLAPQYARATGTRAQFRESLEGRLKSAEAGDDADDAANDAASQSVSMKVMRILRSSTSRADEPEAGSP